MLKRRRERRNIFGQRFILCGGRTAVCPGDAVVYCGKSALGFGGRGARRGRKAAAYALGAWFRDYVYIPLGGSKNVSKRRILDNLFAVWLLTGIWHGANWTFIAWGMLYFVFIAGEKWTRFQTRAIPACLKHLYALLLVVLGWVLFKADSLGAAAVYLQGMFGLGGALLDDLAQLYWRENAVFFLAAGAADLRSPFGRQEFLGLRAKVIILTGRKTDERGAMR